MIPKMGMQSFLYQLHTPLYDQPERFIFVELTFSLIETDIYFLGLGG